MSCLAIVNKEIKTRDNDKRLKQENEDDIQKKIKDYKKSSPLDYHQWYMVPTEYVYGWMWFNKPHQIDLNEKVKLMFMGFHDFGKPNECCMVWSDGNDHLHGHIESCQPFQSFEHITN